MELTPNRMNSRKILMVFLVATVSFLKNNLTDFLIVDCLIEGYVLIASTDAIVTSSRLSLTLVIQVFPLGWMLGG